MKDISVRHISFYCLFLLIIPILDLFQVEPITLLRESKVDRKGWDYNFSVRPSFITAKYFIDYELLQSSTNARVINGKRDMLYLGSDDFFGYDRIINSLSHRSVVSLPSEQYFMEALTKRQRRLKKNNISYYKFVIPNKHTVYPESMPQRYRHLRINDTSLIERLVILKDKQYKDVNLSYLLSSLAPHKEEPLYFHYDSHWTELGAYHGYQVIMDTLKAWIPELKHSSAAQYNTLASCPENSQNCETDFYKYYEDTRCWKVQDLSEAINLSYLQDSIVYFCSSSSATVIEDISEGAHRQLIRTASKVSDANQKILIFRDSYANPLIKFIAPHFKEAVFYWGAYDHKLVLKESPDIVVEINVERYLEPFSGIR